MFRGLAVVLAVSGLLLSGCAKKKDAPARGQVISDVQLSGEWLADMATSSPVDASKNCLQGVERSNGEKVIELSMGACPQDGSLVDALNVIATMKMYSEIDPGEATYLMMGKSEVLDQNTAVGIIENITSTDSVRPSYSISSLCAKSNDFEEDFTANCVVGVKESSIDTVSYKANRPFNRTSRESELADRRKNRENFKALQDADVAINTHINDVEVALKQADETLKLSVVSVNDALKATEVSLRDQDKKLGEADAKLDTKINDSIAAVKTALATTDAKLASVETKLTSDLAALTAEVKKKDGEISADLKAKIEALTAELKTKTDANSADLKAKTDAITADIKSKTDAMNVEIGKKADTAELLKQIKDLRTEITAAIKTVKDDLTATDVANKKELEEKLTAMNVVLTKAQITLISLRIESINKEIDRVKAGTDADKDQQVQALEQSRMAMETELEQLKQQLPASSN